ncbi:MAG TPA: hypothetical protein VFD49_25200 [Candidatus Dormibacteraeota bacterium]|nr:hypothetical protein [Candidatus Dormibacteraeota bacterium]
MRPWAWAGGALTGAAVAGLIVAIAIDLFLPGPPLGRGPILRSVTTEQLAAIGLHLEPAVQPVDLPPWMTSAGIRFPVSIVPRDRVRAEVTAQRGVVGVSEVVLAYATVARWEMGSAPLAHRLVWVVVGTRARGLYRVVRSTQVWLVDASTGAELARLSVPPGGGSGPPAAFAGG